MVLGGPTTVLDLGGLRVVSDPTFDAPGPHGYLTKTAGPAVADDELGPVDLVLVSHDNHPDNLDDRGRALALAAPLVLTTGSGARRLGQPASALAPWTSHTVRRPDGGELTVTAVPAVHGPEDGERDADGFVNCEVIGFVLSGPDLPVIYVSGDNASIRTVTEIARRAPAIDVVVLHAGAARVARRSEGRALTLDSIRAAAAAAILGAAVVIPAHYDGWAHFSEGRDDLARAFADAGQTAQLRLSDHGTWIPLGALLQGRPEQGYDMTEPESPVPGRHPVYGDLPAQVHGLAGRLRLRWLQERHANRAVLGAYVLINATISITILAAVAALTKEPFVFPSLGATAFLVFYDARGAQAAPRNVLCGHLIAVLAGYLALVIFGLTTTPPDLSDVTARRFGAVTVCFFLTLSLMVWLHVPHAPAGATALIVALGLIRTPGQLAILMVAVAAVTVQSITVNRLAGVPYPLWAPRQSTGAG
jgi:L-ascorbate metabolism protein UlaG (beta-lactamase superfamily)